MFQPSIITLTAAGFVRHVAAIVITITAPSSGDTLTAVTAERVWSARLD